MSKATPIVAMVILASGASGVRAAQPDSNSVEVLRGLTGASRVLSVTGEFGMERLPR